MPHHGALYEYVPCAVTSHISSATNLRVATAVTQLSLESTLRKSNTAAYCYIHVAVGRAAMQARRK
jgi:hypothetical protein